MNDEKEVYGLGFRVANHEVMKCIMCYADTINVFNPRIKKIKGLITYYKTYGIIIPKKNVDVDHSIIAKKLKEKLTM